MSGKENCQLRGWKTQKITCWEIRELTVGQVQSRDTFKAWSRPWPLRTGRSVDAVAGLPGPAPRREPVCSLFVSAGPGLLGLGKHVELHAYDRVCLCAHVMSPEQVGRKSTPSCRNPWE